MQYLYVCHFSNGHIKVGRSIDPKARIDSHAERVSCVGIELVEHSVFECVGSNIGPEAALIQKCRAHASVNHKSEWFSGLDFDDVCQWAREFSLATPEVERVYHDGAVLKTRAIALIGSVADAAAAIGVTSAAISQWPEELPPRLQDRVIAALWRLDKPRPDWLLHPTVKQEA